MKNPKLCTSTLNVQHFTDRCKLTGARIQFSTHKHLSGSIYYVSYGELPDILFYMFQLTSNVIEVQWGSYYDHLNTTLFEIHRPTIWIPKHLKQNTKLVRYLNGRKEVGWHMVWYSNTEHILFSYLLVWNSNSWSNT